MKIGFVGGGSGGHFYPLIAVAEQFADYEDAPEMYYFGPSPYNESELTKLHINYIYCPAGKLRRYFSVQNFFDLFRTFFGFFVAIWKLYLVYPDVIFSKGGYTSVPVLQAARFLRIPVVIHESDAVPGRANKLAKKFARFIGIAYDDVAQFFPAEKTALTGIPLRRSITLINENPFQALNLPNDKPLIYVTGGSLGADRLNNITLEILDELLGTYRIIHQTGTVHHTDVVATADSLLQNNVNRDHYQVYDTLPAETVSLLYDAASVVITRAGSTTLFEIATHARPAVIIPIPEDVSRDQRTNAYAFAGGGSAVVIEEQNLTQHLLIDEINTIIGNQAKWQQMAQAARNLATPDAASKIAEILYRIGKEHE